MNVYARRGCCSHHGGVAGCSENGRQICNDGTLSPTCTCTPTITYIYGCTDSSAINYDANASKDDGSCKYNIYGCTDPDADNYNPEANKDDGSCKYYVYGCVVSTAINYNPKANKSDGSCIYKSGCTDKEAINYNEKAQVDNGTYEYKENQEGSLLMAFSVFLIVLFAIKKVAEHL